MDAVAEGFVTLLWLEAVGIERGVSQQVLGQLGMEVERHKWISFPVVKLQKIFSNSMTTEIEIEMLLKLWK